MNVRTCLIAPVAAFAVAAGTSASAQLLQDFTGGGVPTGNYGDASVASGPSADGYNFISGVDDGGTFTGVGGGSLGLNPTDHLFITARLNAGHLNPIIRVLLLEEDGAGTGEAYGYDVDTSLLNTSTFVTLDLGEISTAFDIGPNGAFGRAPGDLAFNIDAGTNTGLYEFQLQTTFTGDAGNAVNITVADVFVDVPEPASAALLGLGGLTMLARRRSA